MLEVAGSRKIFVLQTKKKRASTKTIAVMIFKVHLQQSNNSTTSWKQAFKNYIKKVSDLKY